MFSLPLHNREGKQGNSPDDQENPAHFPFNNGLALTAAGVETSWTPEEGTIITGIRGLQIVNGGQTTASIHRAHKVDGAPLEAACPAKLTVIRTEGDDDRFFDLVRQISLFANSQNKVNMMALTIRE
ncbi:MAG: AIPR family protein [Gemmatimonadetes bacterium]|nr:AIPR family protein [Gemmatimonadota bacterium]